MRTNLQTVLILLFFCTCCCLGQATAPTVEETSNFIVSKLDNSVTGGAYTQSPYYTGTTYWTTSISIVECSVHTRMLVKDTSVSSRTGEKTVQEHVFDEDRINARDLVVSSAGVEVVETKGVNYSQPSYVVYFPIVGRKERAFFFYVQEKSLAIRLQKAFISLGHSCGAKDEPF